MKRAALIFAATTLLLVLVLAGVRDPARWPPPESPPQQGEAALTSGTAHAPAALARLVREPQNTWSNLAFVLGGAWLVARARRRTIRLTGVALLAVGVGSFLYHASASRTLRHADVAAMNGLFLGTIAVCVASWQPKAGEWIEGHAGKIFVVLLGVAVGVTFGRNLRLGGFKPLSLSLLTAFTAAVVIVTLAECARRRATVRAARALVCIGALFGVAAACQLTDRPGGRFFRPDWPLQLHAVWHLLAGLSFTLAMRFLEGNHARRRATVEA